MDAIASMEKTGSSCVLVVGSHNDSEANNLIGIFTEHDIFHITAQRVPLDQLSMQSVMHHPVITIQESALIDIPSVLNIFQQHRIHHLPVLDGDRLVGILVKDNLIYIYNVINSTYRCRYSIFWIWYNIIYSKYYDE